MSTHGGVLISTIQTLFIAAMENKRSFDAVDGAKAAQPAKRQCRSLCAFPPDQYDKIIAEAKKKLPDNVPTDAKWELNSAKQRVELVSESSQRPVELNIQPSNIAGFWSEDGTKVRFVLEFKPDDKSAAHQFLVDHLSAGLHAAYAKYAPQMWGKKPPMAVDPKQLKKKGFKTLQEFVQEDADGGPGEKPKVFNSPFKMDAINKDGEKVHRLSFTMYVLDALGKGDEAHPSDLAEAKASLPPEHPALVTMQQGKHCISNFVLSVGDRDNAQHLSPLETLGKLSFKLPGKPSWMISCGASMQFGGISFRFNSDRNIFTVGIFLNKPMGLCVWGVRDGSGGGSRAAPAQMSSVYDELGIDNGVSPYDEVDAAATA
ncbi:MAG: hypothetical protein CL678_00735 [Bdellovibrionaceae bacterium]|nr:hypothetical protein [Pseudobdellovibrionaceae bacterium]